MQPSNSTGSSNKSLSGLPGGRTVPLQRSDTPRKSGTPTSTRDVTRHRSEIIDQMREEMVSCAKWDKTGFGHYLPFKVSTADIDNAVNALKDADLIREDGSSLRFKYFLVEPFDTLTVNEKKRYEPLEAIANELQKFTLHDGRKASCEFRQQPGVFNGAETHGANFKIDTHLRLKQSTIPPSLGQSSSTDVADIAVPSEYKTDRRDALQNRKQLLGTTNFCMNDDPRRTHIYGITIEDDTMAVWYFSRSHSAKSPDFKFTEHCRTYIEVMLSLMFATEKELGYDPTIQRRLDPETKKFCFVYNVDGTYHKTLKAIFDHRSLCITGRTIRVWEVIQVRSFDELQPLEDSQPMVLKDFWLDVGSKTERNIQREIFADLQRIADELEKKKEPEGFKGMDDESKERLRECLLAPNQDWKRYFLTVVCECQGMKSKEVADAAEPNSTLFDAPRVTIKPATLPHADLSRMYMSQPKALLPHKEKSVNRRYSPKQQSRIVFEQVCVALHDLPKLGDVLTTLSSCVFALQLMFLAGWVHRDISSGNLYQFKNKNGEVQGILADLEYAKPFHPSNGNGSSDPKTGTAFFMAIEIQKQAPLYRSKAPLKKDYFSARAAGNAQSGRPVVVHNFEHDMESIFWILLWTILVRFPCNVDPSKKQKKLAILSEIFQDTSICHPTREEVFTYDGTLLLILAEYLNSQLKSLQLDFQVDALRWALMTGYLEREYDFGNMPSYSILYQYLWETLSRCQELIQGVSLPDLVPCHQAETAKLPCQVRKRRHDQPKAGNDDDEYKQDDDDDECGPVASKKMRGQEDTDMLL